MQGGVSGRPRADPPMARVVVVLASEMVACAAAWAAAAAATEGPAALMSALVSAMIMGAGVRRWEGNGASVVGDVPCVASHSVMATRS